MSLEGMDIEQVQSLARQLSHFAQALTGINAALATVTAELGQYWQGPAPGEFSQQYFSRHRPVLTSAAQAITEMHDRLVANIQQQVQASAADGGAAGGGALAGAGAPGGGAGVLGTGVLGTGVLGTGVLGTGVLGAGSVLGAVASGVSRGWADVSTAEGYVNLAIAPYQFSWLSSNSRIQDAYHILDEAHGQDALSALGAVGAGLGYVSAAVSGYQIGGALASHHYTAAGGDAIQAAAGALESTDDPALMLAGFDISLLKEDYDLARHITWSGIPSPLSVSNLRNDYLPTFEQLPGQVLGALAEAW